MCLLRVGLLPSDRAIAIDGVILNLLRSSGESALSRKLGRVGIRLSVNLRLGCVSRLRAP